MPNTHGGKDRGQGRKPKPPELKRKSVTFRLPPALITKLQNETDQTKLIETLLTQHFERTNKDAA